MALRLERFHVRGLREGGRTCREEGELVVDGEALRRTLMEADDRIAGIGIHLVLPGESTRIVCVKDVVEPRFRKMAGASSGVGELAVLDGVAVVTSGRIVGFQEGIIDMSGPGAAHSPFSHMALVVLTVDPVAGLEPHRHEETVRHAGLRAASFLAEQAAVGLPDRVEVIDHKPLPAGTNGLPSIACVCMVLSQGLLHDTFVGGRNARDSELPRIVSPEFVADNGIVSGNCVSACDKNTTWHHQNNPVIAELLRGHGTEWNFIGVVVTREPTRLSEKEEAARRAVALLGEVGADAAILTKEGFGNPDADLMMLVRGLEAAGIATVAITDEFAGPDGASPSLADTTPEADAIVSTGNANERIVLPAMDRVVGPPHQIGKLAGAGATCVHPDGSLEVELQLVIGATNQLGHGSLRCRTT